MQRVQVHEELEHGRPGGVHQRRVGLGGGFQHPVLAEHLQAILHRCAQHLRGRPGQGIGDVVVVTAHGEERVFRYPGRRQDLLPLFVAEFLADHALQCAVDHSVHVLVLLC